MNRTDFHNPGTRKKPASHRRLPGWTRLFLFMILVLPAQLRTQAQQTVSARIVDAETGEPLPYATIKLANGRGTLSNSDGYFSIEASTGDSLSISYIGYAKLRLAAGRLPRNVKLKPGTTMLQEVEILSSEAILERVAKELNESFKKGKEHRATYFYRTTETFQDKVDMTEAFLESRSAVHLRNLSVLNGHRMQLYDPDSVPYLADLNMHRILELGPLMQKNSFWDAAIAPPFNAQNYKREYICQPVMKFHEGDTSLYRIQLNGKKRDMDGVLYVDGTTWQVRRFEGHLPHIQLLTNNGMLSSTKGVEINVTVEYTYRKGFAEVGNLHYEMKGQDVSSRGVLLNVEDMDLRLPGKGKKIGENMALAVDAAGFDSLTWANSGIIQRTEEEERIAQKHVSPRGKAEAVEREETSEASVSALPDSLKDMGRRYPQELVYVHMDNTCYFLGDTLYYKVYVVRSDRGTPSDISQILYAELLNQDGYLVERQMLRLNDGQGNGSFCLPDTLYAGYYELRAYTRWQLNWGRTEHPHSKAAEKWFLRPDMAADFFRDYDKLYSRVFPLYDKPEEAGEYNRNMTLRPLRRYHKIKAEKPRAEVTLYPEGGAWVEGLRQRLAFEANSPDGEHLNGTLAVYDSKHRVIAEGRTEHRGRGTIELTAQPAESYTAEFRWGDGHIEKVQLPGREKDGAAMSVELEGNRLNVTIARSGNVPAALSLTARTNGIVHYSQDAREETVSIDMEKLPSGVAQLTLHDAKGEVFADRLVFVRHDDLQPGNIKVSGLPEQGNPLEHVTLMLEAPAQATLSVAVRDRALSDPLYDNGTLLTEMLLASQLKGFVEDPGWYFGKDDPAHRRALDLLMMVQGWRRFRWQETPGSFRVEEPFEKYPVIRGDVSRYTALDQEDYFYVLGTDGYRQMLENNLDGTPGQMNRTSGGQSGPLLTEPLALGEELQESDLPDNDHEKNREVLPGEARPFLEGLPIVRGMKAAKSRDAKDTKIPILENMGRNIILYTSSKADPKNFQSLSPLKANVTLHAKFSVPVQKANNVVNGEMQTSNGQFTMQAPTTNGYHFMFLSASKKEDDNIFMPGAERRPDYSVRVRPFYPRFVKPYSYYQSHLSPLSEDHPDHPGEDGSSRLREVSVGARRGGLRGFDKDHPILIMDAYDAFNQTVDAGLSPAWYAGSLSFSIAAARLFIGDMGTGRAYQLERRWDGRTRTTHIPIQEQHEYNYLKNLRSVTIYSDYAPRLEGDPRYQASDQPVVTLSLDLVPNNGMRSNYRDRFYVMPGLSVCEAFYQPDYSKQKLPEKQKDYRRTLYWNPFLRLDESGRATVSFFNNSRQNQFSVSAEGITENGMILTSEISGQ